MRLLSPEEDFHRNTVDKVGGVLGRARYFANLKEPGGSLHHWGLERQYGRQRAAEILQRCCTEQIHMLLQQEMSSLWQEAQTISQENALDPATLLRKLARDLEEVLPDFVTKLQLRHFRAVLHALSEVAAHQHSKSDSLQGPRLVQ